MHLIHETQARAVDIMELVQIGKKELPVLAVWCVLFSASLSGAGRVLCVLHTIEARMTLKKLKWPLLHITKITSMLLKLCNLVLSRDTD